MLNGAGCSHRVSSGGAPFPPMGGEFFVGSSAEFEFSDPGGPYPEVISGGCKGEVQARRANRRSM
jgi:hypothetical protein